MMVYGNHIGKVLKHQSKDKSSDLKFRKLFQVSTRNAKMVQLCAWFHYRSQSTFAYGQVFAATNEF
jgi:hypothetical protein